MDVKSLDTSYLEKNIIEMLREQQLKLGYMKEKVRLYYPLQTLNRFLHTSFNTEEMQKVMEYFAEAEKKRVGTFIISHDGERFCFLCAEDVALYVHEHMDGAEFLKELISTVAKHGITVEEVINIFYKYSEHVCVKKDISDEFECLVYFENGVPDDFRYCLSCEGHHVIYHRFTEADYTDIYGE